ncbi:hypothetical protein HK098_005821 [Nowakowskiella sp. JEL0407]|nr:hypothetical protein HK098_005821 [Nowakowskiella sp. JEL0407]
MGIHDLTKTGDLEKIIRECANSPEEENVGSRDDHENTILHIACQYSRDNVCKWAIEQGAELNSRNDAGDTPLIISVKSGSLKIVEMLLAEKADVNMANDHGNTPLHYACFWRRDEIISALLKNGALPSLKNKYGRLPSDRADSNMALKLQGLASMQQNVPQNAPARSFADAQEEAKKRFFAKGGVNWEINPKTVQVTTPITEGGRRAEVFKGNWNNYTVAIKRLVDQEVTPRQIRSFRQEIQNIRKQFHPNILTILGACPIPPNVCVLTEFSTRGNLFNYLHDPSNEYDHNMAIRFTREICNALAYLHQQTPPIFHYNLKPRNILLREDLTIQVSDFGFKDSCFGWFSSTNPEQQKFILDVEYLAPEVLRDGFGEADEDAIASELAEMNVTGDSDLKKESNMKKLKIDFAAVDIYAFGIVMYEILMRERPYEGVNAFVLGMQVL